MLNPYFCSTMKIKVIIIALLFLVACTSKSPHKSNPDLIYDDLGNKFNIKKIPEKVVSLAPNLTEIIYFIGAEKYLEGVTTYCTFPKEAKSKEKVGDLISVDFEKLIKIKPDIIFMTVEGNSKTQYEKIKSLGFKVFVSNPRSFMGIEKTIRDIGTIFHKQKQTEAELSRINKTLDSLKSASTDVYNVKSLFLISVKPLMAAGKNTFINEYLHFFGLKNIAADAAQSYPVIGSEYIIKSKPDIILLPSKMKKFFAELVDRNPVLREVTAIRKNKIISIDPDLYFKPGPRFVDALQNLKLNLDSLKLSEGN
jgi:iron complex transport system substrate-binding protein